MLDHEQQYRYQVGGPLSDDNLTYVEREADKDLYEALIRGEYSYVLNSRQMGKSSLVVRTRKKLEAEGYIFAYIDLTLVGTEGVSLDQWCTTLLSNLADSFQLPIDASSWWKNHEGLAPFSRMTKFIETFMLTKDTQNRYIIVIDEIDTVLSLNKFRADDFFAFVRGCCIQRTNKPEYHRLTFVLIGTATPSDLIADRDRTPFNLGRAIALYGFRSSEVYPLAKGLNSHLIVNPQIVLEAILEWTGGQPFLTQKLCYLLQENQVSIPSGQEFSVVEQFVKHHIISNWEGNDKPQHLRTIRDRIIRNIKHNNILEFKDEQHSSSLLSLYQKILEYGKISADNSPEQEDLRLSGLVLKQDGVLKVYSRIYQDVFNAQWVQKELAKLRPYREQLKEWAKSNYLDESRLLHGKALQDALIWADDKQLSDEDKQFLDTSQAFEQISQVHPEVSSVLRRYLPQLQTITCRLSVVIAEVCKWGGTIPLLIEQICQVLIQEKSATPIPAHQEVIQIEQVIREHLIQNWENQAIAPQIQTIQTSLLDNEHRKELLRLWLQILNQEANLPINSSEWKTLEKLGLIKNQLGNDYLDNQIYASILNQKWVEEELSKKQQIIGDRYEVIRKFQPKLNSSIQTYLAKDQHRSKQYVIKELALPSTDNNKLEEIKRLISRKLRDFGKIDSSVIPDLDPYFDEDRFYIIQEYIEGHNLDEEHEITSKRRWNETEVIELLVEILGRLTTIHEQGLAHYNLKPSNLRRQHQNEQSQVNQVSHNPSIVPIDFGFLKEIAAAIENPDQMILPPQIGTPGYTPPENTGEWSGANCDIYAIGMIGIQALTGIEPKDLPKDQQTGEIIWRFATSERPMIQVSDELARILTRMVRHPIKARYDNTSDVYQDLKKLQTRKRSPYAWLTDKRLLATSIGVLLLTNIFSLWWFQRSFNDQALTQRSSESTAQQKLWIQQCNRPIQSQSKTKDRLLTVDMVNHAKEIIRACDQVSESQASLVNKGKALLLLSRSSLKLNQKESSKTYLSDARHVFLKARDIDRNNPQAHFYLGVVNQLLGNKSHKKEYEQSTQLYLSSNPDMQADDYFIITKLASVAQNSSNPNDTIKLYEKAIDIKPNPADTKQQANLRYNQATLNDQIDGRNYSSSKTRRYLNLATELEPQHKLTDEYSNTCLGSGENRAPTICAGLSTPLPVYSCQKFPILSIAELDKTRNRSLCE